MRSKRVSDKFSTVVIDRPTRGLKPVGEQGSSRRLIPRIPNSCVDVKSASRKAGNRKDMSESIFVGIDVSKDQLDRKSTRLNSSHVKISYAVFCLKKKIKIN